MRLPDDKNTFHHLSQLLPVRLLPPGLPKVGSMAQGHQSIFRCLSRWLGYVWVSSSRSCCRQHTSLEDFSGLGVNLLLLRTHLCVRFVGETVVEGEKEDLKSLCNTGIALGCLKLDQELMQLKNLAAAVVVL